MSVSKLGCLVDDNIDQHECYRPILFYASSSIKVKFWEFGWLIKKKKTFIVILRGPNVKWCVTHITITCMDPVSRSPSENNTARNKTFMHHDIFFKRSVTSITLDTW
jgi:hypothetical protein